jgi:hypothetical protein
MSNLSRMSTPSSSQESLKRHAECDSIDTRVTKVAKVSAVRPLSISISDFPRRMQEQASSFASRQNVVHGILMSQLKLPTDSVHGQPATTLDISPVVTSPIPVGARTSSQRASTATTPATESATVDDASTVRRSTRPRKNVNYRDSLRGKPEDVASVVTSMVDEQVPTASSKTSKQTGGKLFEMLIQFFRDTSLANTQKAPKNNRKKPDRPGRASSPDVEATTQLPVAELAHNGNPRRSARTKILQLIDFLKSPEVEDPQVSTSISQEHKTITSRSDESQSNTSPERTLAELEAWLKAPARPKKFPLEVAAANPHFMKLSYNQIGTKPPPGLADKLVREMEKRHAAEVQGWSDDEDDEDPWK